MTRPSSSGSGKSPTTPSSPTMLTSPRKKKSPQPSHVPARSSLNSMQKMSGQIQQRREFLHHLTKWSLDHDASLQFQGKISLLPRDVKGGGDLELGKPVTCVLTDTKFSDARQKLVIKLFPPQVDAQHPEKCIHLSSRHDSLDLYEVERFPYLLQGETDHSLANKQHELSTSSKARYKLVVRCGAGWMSARDYFNKTYFSRLEAQRISHHRCSLSESLEKRSRALGVPPLENDSVTIRPLFHPFRRLPAELQEMVLRTAAGLSRTYDLCSDDNGIPSMKKKPRGSAISLSTLLRVSKGINEHLLPFIYHSMDFQFGLTGFTSFLWQSGPTNRREIRRLTFHFGKLALLHCIRWLAPDPVFGLFEPPVATNPRSLQYFWRCQIQELIKDLNLLTLTINIKHTPTADLPMIVAIMKSVLGSVDRVRFIEAGRDGISMPVEMHDERLKGLRENQSWRQMCLGYYQRHRKHSYFYKFELLKCDEKALDDEMDRDKGFYDTVFSPLAENNKIPRWKET